MTRAEKICLWIYAGLLLLCVVLFRSINILLIGCGLGETEELLTIFFFVIGLIMMLATGKKGSFGAEMAVLGYGTLMVAGILYGTAWVCEHVRIVP